MKSESPVIQGVVLFDGMCVLCNSAVRFIMRNDPGARLRFASLQSEAGKRLLGDEKLPLVTLDSVIYIENNRILTKSRAFFAIARQLRFPWPTVLIFSLIPTFLSDRIYDLIAKNRYRWFGRRETCALPASFPGFSERVID
jgi:predicted DCC family thiol-disulfide oxidoreductase YuxK